MTGELRSAGADPVMPLVLEVGDRVKFAGERLRYRVRATAYQFAVCTKRFNPRRTVLYTVIDFERGIRGTENLIFGMGAETDQDCEEMLVRLVAGETSVSRRNYALLDIESVVK